MDEHAHEDAAMPYTPLESEAPKDNTERVLEANRHRLMRIAGVEMVGIGRNSLGDPVIIIGVRDEGVISKLPGTIEGVGVQAEVTGPIDALSNRQRLRP
jgi:hypothetical protein